MQFTDLWPLVAQLTANSLDGWWLLAWHQWGVYLALAYAGAVLLYIFFRPSRPGLTVQRQTQLNLISWLVSLALFLIIPSLLASLVPNFVLRLAGFTGVGNLQQLSPANWAQITAVLRHLTWQGTLGAFFVLVASLHPAMWPRRRPQPQPAPAAALNPTPMIDELTPFPTQEELPASMAALEISPMSDEMTLIPSPPLPLAAWLRSISYKGGNNQIFELTVQETEIGRQQGHITLNADLSISSRHAVIKYRQGQFFLEDASRYQSSWVNEISVDKEKDTPLRDGDVIRFGESKFSFHRLAWPELEVVGGADKGKVIKDQPVPILIGSGEHNHLTIQGEEIAEVQARIELDRLQKKFILRPEGEGATNNIELYEDSGEAALALEDPPWPLADRTRIKIGPQALQIKYKDQG